jgi:hypothetical protein
MPKNASHTDKLSVIEQIDKGKIQIEHIKDDKFDL